MSNALKPINFKPAPLAAMPDAFLAGRNIGKAEAAAMALLAAASKAGKVTEFELVHAHIKAGLMSDRMFPTGDISLAQANLVWAALNKSGADRTEAEAKAEGSARRQLSRLMERYEIKTLENRGGSRGRTGSRKPKKIVKPKSGKGTVRTEELVPTFKTGVAFEAHLRLMIQTARGSLKKSTPNFKAKAKRYAKLLREMEALIAAE